MEAIVAGSDETMDEDVINQDQNLLLIWLIHCKNMMFLEHLQEV